MDTKHVDNALQKLYEIWLANGEDDVYAREMAYFCLEDVIRHAGANFNLKSESLKRLTVSGKLELSLFLKQVLPEGLEAVKRTLGTPKFKQLLDKEVADLKAEVDKQKK